MSRNNKYSEMKKGISKRLRKYHFCVAMLFLFTLSGRSQNLPKYHEFEPRLHAEGYYKDTVTAGIKSVCMIKTMEYSLQRNDTSYLKTYDETGRVVSDTTYYSMGNKSYLDYWYSESGLQKAVIKKQRNSNYIELSTFDSNGKILNTKTYRGEKIQDTVQQNFEYQMMYQYDVSGRIISKITPGKNSSEFFYNDKGLLELLVNKYNTKSYGCSIKKYVYDASNQLVEEYYFDMRDTLSIKPCVKTMTYSNDMLVAWTRECNHKPNSTYGHELSYDNQGRLIKLSIKDGDEFGWAEYTYLNNRVLKTKAKMSGGNFSADLGVFPASDIGEFECEEINYFDAKGNIQRIECFVGSKKEYEVLFVVEYYK